MNGNISPYEVLGVNEKDSLEHIEYVYQQFMKSLHPDRANTKEARQLNMSEKDKNVYLQMIRTAYNTIMSNKRETKYPDYNMDYKIEQESRINMHDGLTKEDAKNFNNTKFNSLFEQTLERDKKAGMTDPFGRGYGEFDVGKKFTDNKQISMPSYSGDIDVMESKNFHKSDNRLAEYLPESSVYSDLRDFQELGISNVSDFSVTVPGKGSFGGTDLMTVYGQNLEPWEKVIMRDPKYSAKFNDETDISRKMNQLETDRGSIYDLPMDHKLMEAEKMRNFASEQQEKMRMSNKNYRDEYFNELNKGRLKDTSNLHYMTKKMTRS